MRASASHPQRPVARHRRYLLEEVANAAARVLRANIALSQDELVKLTAKSLGFPRASGRVAEHLSAAVALLVKRGRAQRDGDKVVLA